MKQIAPAFIVIALVILACGGPANIPTATPRPRPTPTSPPSRLASIPADAPKRTPADDPWPPLVAEGWSQPIPLPGPINTAGAEDGPFLTLDGQTFYFFFTPDVRIPVERQLFDGLTGIWVTYRSGETWSEPERVHLSAPGALALDGCEFVMGNLMYFCTTREGYTGMQWFRAAYENGAWQGWRFAGEELKQYEYEVGELQITANGQELYFHSPRAGGSGGLDIWVSQKTPAGWGEPLNLGPVVNTPADEGWPYVSPDGQELWFTGQSRKGLPGPAIFRSIRQPDGAWSEPEEIVSQFAGEPTLAADGTALYFTHHYFSPDLSQMLEADIYVTYRIAP